MVSARPSNNTFYHHFYNDMKLSKGKKVGADIACQHLMHYRFFQTDHVICVDKLAEVFNNFKDIEKTGRATFLVGDITQLDINPGSIDFVVSTHTLSHLKEEQRYYAVESLVKLVNSSGNLLFNIPYPGHVIEKKIDKLLSENFRKVKKVPYRNIFSDAYEHLIADQRGFVSFPYDKPYIMRLMKGISRLLAYMEAIPIRYKMLYYFSEK